MPTGSYFGPPRRFGRLQADSRQLYVKSGATPEQLAELTTFSPVHDIVSNPVLVEISFTAVQAQAAPAPEHDSSRLSHCPQSQLDIPAGQSDSNSGNFTR